MAALILLALLVSGCDADIIPEGGGAKPVTTVEGLTSARVRRVIDGDTIEVSMSTGAGTFDGQVYTLRYIGIDSPETVRPNHPVEWMGPEATAANEALVEGRIVYLEKDVSETDSFGRLLRYVYLAESPGSGTIGTMVNAELVRQGYAHSSAYPPDVKHQALLDAAEREAREAGRGLWGPGPLGTAPLPATAVASPLPGARREAGMVIATIHYRGDIKPDEPDEYVEIRNSGTVAVDLAGWRLNAGSEGQDIVFPAFRMEPGQTCRVYTNQVHMVPAPVDPETCGFTFGSEGALWNNSGDCGRLYDAAGALVFETCY